MTDMELLNDTAHKSGGASSIQGFSLSDLNTFYTYKPKNASTQERLNSIQKLKDYFIDLKIPREERDRILLVAEGSEVFWVVGYRISERVRITEKTGSMLQIEYIPAVAGI